MSYFYLAPPTSGYDLGVSVILPTFCRFEGGFLQRAISSYLAAAESVDFNVELLAYVDGSVDGSHEFLVSLAKNSTNIRVFYEPQNVGLPARTTISARHLSRYSHLTWLLDDIEWHPSFLATLFNGALASDADVCYGKVSSCFDKVHDTVVGEDFDPQILARIRNIIPAGGVLVKKSVFERFGWFDTCVVERRTCDHDLWIRLSGECSFVFIDQIIAEERGSFLTNSLGHTSSFYPEVVARWRVYRHATPKMCEGGYFDHNFLLFLADPALQCQYLTLILEHLVNIDDFKEAELIFRSIISSNILSTVSINIKSKSAEGILKELLVRLYQREFINLRSTIIEYRAAIDERQAFIDSLCSGK